MKDEVKSWMDKGLSDFDTAEKLYELEKYEDSAFYCQQAAEKLLKALIIHKTNSFPKIHDLAKLARLLNSPTKIIEFCSKLNPAYTIARYPDSAREYTKEEAEKLIEYCREVLEWTKKKLSS